METSWAGKDELLYGGTHTAKMERDSTGVSGFEHADSRPRTLPDALFLGPLRGDPEGS